MADQVWGFSFICCNNGSKVWQRNIWMYQRIEKGLLREYFNAETGCKRIFEEIDFTEKHNFIDMGCGKGYVMAKAAEYPFEKVGGG